MVAPGDLINRVTLIPQIPSLNSFIIPTLPEVGDLFNLLTGAIPGGLFQNPLSGPIADCLAEIGVLSGNPSNSSLFGVFSSTTTALNSFQSHTDSTISGLPLNMNPVIAGLRVRQSVGGGLPGGNPCTALNDIFGSILGEGAKLIALLVAALASLIPQSIIDAIASIAKMIADEIQALTALLQLLQNFASSNLLSNLSFDPCAQALFNSVGTPGLLNALPSMPKF